MGISCVKSTTQPGSGWLIAFGFACNIFLLAHVLLELFVAGWISSSASVVCIVAVWISASAFVVCGVALFTSAE